MLLLHYFHLFPLCFSVTYVLRIAMLFVFSKWKVQSRSLREIFVVTLMCDVQ